MRFKIERKISVAVTDVLNKLKREYSEEFSQGFESIARDNETEFSKLSKLEIIGCKIYFTHFIPLVKKGQMKTIMESLDDLSQKEN